MRPAAPRVQRQWGSKKWALSRIALPTARTDCPACAYAILVKMSGICMPRQVKLLGRRIAGEYRVAADKLIQALQACRSA